jgi:hypothetical protein
VGLGSFTEVGRPSESISAKESVIKEGHSAVFVGRKKADWSTRVCLPEENNQQLACIAFEYVAFQTG